MLPRIILALLSALTMISSVFAGEEILDSPRSQIPILGWYSVPETELNLERFEEMVEMGLTHSLMSYSPEGNLKALDLAEQVGLKLFISDRRFLKDRSERWEAVQLYRGHPALEGYTLRDEPSASDFANLTAARNALEILDPDSWSYVNLLPTYASPEQLGTDTYPEHADRFVNQFRPEVLSFDHYSILKGNQLREDFFQNLEWIRQAAQDQGIPFWAFALTCPHHPYPTPTAGSIRFQVWSAFSYGAKGIQYFTYWTPRPGRWDFHDAPIREDGSRSPVYDLLKTINREIQSVAPIFTQSRVTGIWHSHPIPKGAQGVNASCPVETMEGGPALISLHQLDDGQRFVQITNRSFTDSSQYEITPAEWITGFTPVESRLSFQFTAKEPRTISLQLPPGGSALLKVNDPQTSELVLKGTKESELAPHGTGNIYAPEIRRDGDRLLMWYGGQGRDGHDRIHLAVSEDQGAHWRKRGVVMENGSANHVNDPTVVRVKDKWWMFYTVAETAENDQIAAATSSDGERWNPLGIVIPVGAGTDWDSYKVGRPTVLWGSGKFRIWYDVQSTATAAEENDLARKVRRSGRAIAYAESCDGVVWNRHPEPVFYGVGAIDVARFQDKLIMTWESGNGIYWATSQDGLQWEGRGLLVELTGERLDQFGQVTPFLDVLDPERPVLYSGGASRRTWDGNAIMRSYVDIVRIETQ